MAKTFNLSDPGHYEAYLAESLLQMTLYGGICLTRGEDGWITVLDAADLIAPAGQPGFVMVTGDGEVLPVPEAAP